MNKNFDAWIARPVTNAYTKVVPLYARTRVSNFFNNLSDLNTAPNQFIQLKPREGWNDLQRFVINSTVGLLGLYDVASHWGYEIHEEDLGQTLGFHGVPPGPYLVIPLIGPTTGREFFGDMTTSLISRFLFLGLDPTLTTGIRILDTVDYRARTDRNLNMVEKTAVDEYIFIREAYIQHRNYLLFDGNPPVTDLDDLHLEETHPEDEERIDKDDSWMDDDFLLEGEAGSTTDNDSTTSPDDWENDLETELLKGTDGP